MPRSACWQEPYTAVSWGSARAWHLQRWMLAANHWTDHGVPSGGVRERTEGICNPIGRTTISTNQSSQGLNHKPRSTLRGTHGSSNIFRRGWSCQASMGEEALGSVEAWCPNVGKWEGREAEVGGWMGAHSHRSKRRGDGIEGVLGGNQERG